MTKVEAASSFHQAFLKPLSIICCFLTSSSFSRTPGSLIFLFAFSLHLFSSSAFSLSLDRGPYLLAPLPGSIEVVWKTDLPSRGSVSWLDGQEWKRIEAPGRSTRHVVVIRDLQPDTVYQYRIHAPNNSVLASSSFRTAPSPGTDRRVHVDFMGDTRRSRKDVIKEMSQILEKDAPELLVHLGDFAYRFGKPAEYDREFFRPFKNVLQSTPLYGVLGNHDATWRTGFADAFPAYVPDKKGRKAWYSFEYGPVHVTVLDTSSDFAKGSPQNKWLEGEMATLQQRRNVWNVVALHHPPYSTGFRGSKKTVREILAPVFEQYKVDLVLSGHTHAYQRSEVMAGANGDGIIAPLYVVSGGGGSPLFKQVSSDAKIVRYVEAHHFMHMSATRSELSIQAVSMEGYLLDSLTLSREFN